MWAVDQDELQLFGEAMVCKVAWVGPSTKVTTF
jgi:hypothetical protein